MSSQSRSADDCLSRQLSKEPAIHIWKEERGNREKTVEIVISCFDWLAMEFVGVVSCRVVVVNVDVVKSWRNKRKEDEDIRYIIL